MSFSGSSIKCHQCAKTVYKAEEKLMEGFSFHAQCYSKWIKARQDEELKSRSTFNPDLHNLPKPINPGHGYGGVVSLDGKNILDKEGDQVEFKVYSPRKNEELINQPQQQQQQQQPKQNGSDEVKVNFCVVCGDKATGGKFCPGCGFNMTRITISK